MRRAGRQAPARRRGSRDARSSNAARRDFTRLSQLSPERSIAGRARSKLTYARAMRFRTAAVVFSGFVVLGLPTGMLGIAWPTIRAARIGAVLVATGSWRLGYLVAALAFVALAVATYVARSELRAAPETEDAAAARPSARSPVVVGAALLFVYVGIELGAGQWS